MYPRIALAVAIVLVGTGLVAAQVLPPGTSRVPVSAVPVDLASQVATLQQQIASLQAAVSALQFKTQLISSNGVSFSVTSGASAVTLSPAGVAVTSPIVTLNGNNGTGRPAARAQDQVQTPFNGGTGQITQGSPTVLIGG